MLQRIQQGVQNQQDQMQQQRGPLYKLFFTVGRIIFVSVLFNVVKRFVLPQVGVGENGAIMNTTSVIPKGVPVPTTCAFTPHDRATLYVYTSYEEKFNRSSASLIWREEGITYDWAGTNERNRNVTVDVTPELLANKTMYAHIFLVKGRHKPRATRHMTQIYTSYELTLFHAPPKADHRKNLLENDENDEKKSKNISDVTNDVIINNNETLANDTRPWIMYWKPSLEVRLVADSHATPLKSLPEPIKAKYQMDFNLGVYWPVLFVNTFWLKYDMLVPVNETVTSLPLSLHFSPMSMLKLSLFVQMESQLQTQISWSGGVVEEEMDEIKRILTETNPYFLGLTMVVSIVHSIFDFLAFKNDISFWKSRKSVAGLSVKTLMMQAVCGVIIFLYLLDNETSWMILISAGVGSAIDIWKIGKAAKLSLQWKTLLASPRIAVPWIKISDRESYTKSKTKVYDEMAMRYLSYALYPLVAGYAVYSLVYDKHKSWYSWVIGSLTGAVYTFGFIMMTPQLFINYKLKSVAHLPWRALVYKSLNTFIDDLFAFIIKMPTMHRIACFRDDVIFFIYLFQRWKYPVDKNRLESLSWEDAENDFEEQQQQQQQQGEKEKKKKESETEKKKVSTEVKATKKMENKEKKADTKKAEAKPKKEKKKQAPAGNSNSNNNNNSSSSKKKRKQD